MEEGSEQTGRLVAWPCRRSDEGGSGGTAHTPLLPPPEPLAPAPLPREKARRERRAPAGERQFSFRLCWQLLCVCVSLPLAEGERQRGESLSAVLVQLKISGHV